MKRTKVLLVVSYLIPVLLFALVAYFSFGYDDEYFNVINVNNVDSLIDCYKQMNSTDIHPPLSYMINYIFFQFTGDWRIVRSIGAILVSTSLWFFWSVREKNIAEISFNKVDTWFSYMLICLNPTVLLWATGIRWYTYMVILVCILGMLFYAKGKWINNKYLFWGVYFLLCVLVFHLEYSGAILIIASFLCFLMKRKDKIKEEWYIVLLFGLLAVAAVAYQIYIFLTIHYANGQHEIGSILKALVYTAQHLLCGQAVVPVSIMGILLLLGNAILFMTMLINCIHMWKEIPNRFCVLSYIGIVISGIGIKIRNYTPLSPILGGGIYGCIYYD